MNVGLIYPYYLPILGGVEKNLHEIASYLSMEGHQVTIITNQIDPITINVLGSEGVKPIPNMPLIDRETDKITVIRWPLPSFLLPFSSVRKYFGQPLHYSLYLSKVLTKIGKLYEIEVFYAAEPACYIALYLSNFFNTKVMRNIRKVAGIRSNTYVNSPLRKKAAQKIFRSFDAVIVSNVNTILYRHIKELSPLNTFFIPNWVDTERFKPYPKHEAQCVLGIEGYDKVILSVGRFVYEKGAMNIIKAFERFLKLGGDRRVLLLLVGSGPLERWIRAYVNRKGLISRVKIMKPFLYTSPLYPMVYSASDIFIHIPFHDGLSNVVTEALASGVQTVIHSNVRGIPKAIMTYLKRVSFSIDDVAKAILEAVEEKDSRKRFEGRKVVEEYFGKKKLLPLFAKTLLGSG